ncbi:hypothetical protein HYW75_02410 [Candidatus Pacearchaeota archaeon]|nr:hypothetical protein [Candidatus Pacearchaeota archaeon]
MSKNIAYNNKRSEEVIVKYFGALKNKNIDWKTKEERMKAFRDSFNKKIEKTREYMENAK